MRIWQVGVRFFFRFIVPLAIMVAVGWQFAMILRRPELSEVNFACRIEYLLPAMVLYLAAHTIWASFWSTLLAHQGIDVPHATALRAYFVSQYGKYIPGKVWVIVIRVAMLGGNRKNKALVGVTATYEALTSMAAGAILGAVLLPLLDIDLGFGGRESSVLIAIAAVPLGIGLLHRLVVRVARRRLGPDVDLPTLNILVLVRGLIQTSAGWFLLGLSVWMVMQAVRPDVVEFRWIDFIRVTAINCLSYVLGFVILIAPAGGGVREYVLKVLLAHELIEGLNQPVAEGLAVVVALVVRLIWTLAELILALLLYKFVPGVHAPLQLPVLKEMAE